MSLLEGLGERIDNLVKQVSDLSDVVVQRDGVILKVMAERGGLAQKLYAEKTDHAKTMAFFEEARKALGERDEEVARLRDKIDKMVSWPARASEIAFETQGDSKQEGGGE